MPLIQHFTDLQAWQMARSLASQIYILARAFPDDEKFAMTSQLRRAACSVGANLAEGFARKTNPDRTHFYRQARGSLIEIQHFLILAGDLGFVDAASCREAYHQCDTIAKLINGLIRSHSPSTKN